MKISNYVNSGCLISFYLKCVLVLSVCAYNDEESNLIQEIHTSKELNELFEELKDAFFHSNTIPERQIIVWNEKWPNGIVYYEISPEFNQSSRMLIYQAMEEISEKTCIKYMPHENKPDYIYFEKKFGDGCHTHAGRKGGKQILNLDPQRCIQHGKIMHELLHVLGFHHEHQRPDRDNYIKIFWDNVKREDRDQFTILDAPELYLKDIPYDYSSILHYGNISFYLAVDRDKPILKSKRFAPHMGQRIFLSDLDVFKVNFLYNCHTKLEKYYQTRNQNRV